MNDTIINYNDYTNEITNKKLDVMLKSTVVPKLEYGKHMISYIELLKLCQEDRLFAYPHNRGDGKPSNKTVNIVKNDFYSESFEALQLAKQLNGKFEVMNGNGRLTGLLHGLRDKTIKPKDILTPVNNRDKLFITVVPSDAKIKVYQGANTGSPHTANEKLRNSDLAFGSIINEILNDLGEEYVKFYGKAKNYPTLSYIVYGLKEVERRRNITSFSDVYDLRKFVGKNANKTKHELNLFLNKDSKELFKKGLIFWKEYITGLQVITDQHGIQLIRCFNTKGWMGAVMCDVIFNESNLFHKTPKGLAEASYKKSLELKNYIGVITGGKKNMMKSLLIEINSILRGNKTGKR